MVLFGGIIAEKLIKIVLGFGEIGGISDGVGDISEAETLETINTKRMANIVFISM